MEADLFLILSLTPGSETGGNTVKGRESAKKTTARRNAKGARDTASTS